MISGIIAVLVFLFCLGLIVKGIKHLQFRNSLKKWCEEDIILLSPTINHDMYVDCDSYAGYKAAALKTWDTKNVLVASRSGMRWLLPMKLVIANESANQRKIFQSMKKFSSKYKKEVVPFTEEEKEEIKLFGKPLKRMSSEELKNTLEFSTENEMFELAIKVQEFLKTLEKK